MSFPTIRITITSAERALVKLGLDHLVNGLASASRGLFPHRHPWDRIEPQWANVYKDQAFDTEMARRLLSVHEKLGGTTSSQKVRLDAFEIAALALALRLFKASLGIAGNRNNVASGARKLEMHRKRAKVRAVRAFGHVEYQQAAVTWKRFVMWCRYNLTYSTFPKPPGFPRKRRWAEQRTALSFLIAQTLETRCYTALAAPEMKRMVTLLKAEFRRGRHSLTLMELLASERDAVADMIFKLVAKKLTLTPLPGAALSVCVLASQRGEKFEAARARRANLTMPTLNASQTGIPANSLVSESNIVQPSGIQIPAMQPPATLRNDHVAQSNADLSEAFSRWMQNNVDRRYWDPLINFTIAETLARPRFVAQFTATKSLDSIIAETRPVKHIYTLSHVPDLICYLATWLLKWLYACRASASDIPSILFAGGRQAFREYEFARTAA